jgi:HEAT repeat protein
VAPATRRRGAICAALGAVACTGLLVALWSHVRDPPADPPAVSSGRSDDAVRAPTPPQQSTTGSPPSTSDVDDRDALDALILALSDANANVRVDAVSDLGLLSDPQAESLLAITAMQDPEPAVRAEALYALGMRRADSQLAVFRHALDDPDADVRKAAIGALEEIGGDTATTLLTTALSDHDAAIRATAEEALTDLRTAR